MSTFNRDFVIEKTCVNLLKNHDAPTLSVHYYHRRYYYYHDDIVKRGALWSPRINKLDSSRCRWWWRWYTRAQTHRFIYIHFSSFEKLYWKLELMPLSKDSIAFILIPIVKSWGHSSPPAVKIPRPASLH